MGTPSATLTRMVDPVWPRNPDSYMAMIKNGGDLQNLIEVFMGMGKVSIPASTNASGFERTAGGLKAHDAVNRSRVRPPPKGGSR
jgi:hypothetical protein